MAQFLRVGDYVINMDLVTDIHVSADSVSIFLLSHQINGPGGRVLAFDNEEAAIIGAWIARNAEWPNDDRKNASTGVSQPR
jgi:hypothetical protein